MERINRKDPRIDNIIYETLVRKLAHWQLPGTFGQKQTPVKLYSYYVKQELSQGGGKDPVTVGMHTIGCVVFGKDPDTGKWCRGISIAAADQKVRGKGYGRFEAYNRWEKAAKEKSELRPEHLPNGATGKRFMDTLRAYGNDLPEKFMSCYDCKLNEFEQRIVDGSNRTNGN